MFVDLHEKEWDIMTSLPSQLFKWNVFYSLVTVFMFQYVFVRHKPQL